ncbi:hypothetical protein ACTG9Q_26825 [Actinokineospora sp. 24-640]
MSDLGHEFHVRDESGCGSLTADEVRVLRAAKLAKSAAGAIAPVDLQAEIRRLPPQTSAFVRQQLKLRKSAPLGVYSQTLLARLTRAPDDLTIKILHDVLPAVVTFTWLTEELDRAELVALLSGDPDRLRFLADSEILVELLGHNEGSPRGSTWVAGWAAMASAGHAGSTAALAWLVADPPDFWGADQLSAIETAWGRLREREPELPERPIPLYRLTQVVKQMDESGSFALNPDFEDWADGDAPPSVEPDSTWTEGRLDELSARHAEIGQAVAAVQTDVLPELSVSLGTGRIPDPERVSTLLDVIGLMTALFDDIASAGHGEPPESLEHARALLDDLAATSASNALLDRIRLLTGLRAPDYFAAEAAAIADLAAGVDQDTDPVLLTSLDAFLAIVELAGTDPQRGAELARVVQVGLPSAMPLLMSANTGDLEVASLPHQESDGNVSDGTHREDVNEGQGDPRPVLLDAEAPDASGEPVRDAAPAAEVANAETDVAQTEGDGELSLDHDDDLATVIADLSFTIPAPQTPEPAAAASPNAPNPNFVPGADRGAPQPDLAVAPEDAPGQHTELLSRLLRDRKFALASWLSDALDQPPADSAVFRLTAHGVAIRSSLGSNAAAFADIAKGLDADDLHDRLGLQMLVYAASVRAGLLSPIASAATVLRDVTTSIVKTGHAVENLTDALLTAFYSGVYLTPQSAGAVVEAAGAEAEHERLAATARSMLKGGPSRTIRYVAATELWQSWISPTGYLGRPLAILASGSQSAEDVSIVRAQVAELRSRPNVEAALDRDSLVLRTTKRRPRKIEARARDKILDWTNDVTELLAMWVAATDNLNRPATGTWMADPMADLRRRVTATRATAIAELATLTGSGSPTRDAAIDIGLALLSEALDLLGAPVALNEVEVAADRVIAGQLALAMDLPLDVTLAPLRPVTVDDVAAASEALAAAERGWTASFAGRLARHDHVGAQILVETLRPTDPRLAQRLSAERDSAVTRSIEKLDGKVVDLLQRIDSDRRFGRLNYDQWTDLSSRARAYEAGSRGTRRDFDTMMAALDEIETGRDTAVGAACEAAREALAGLRISADDLDRIRGCIDQGDITTANEFRETLRSGRDLPAPKAELQHLTRFYPAFPELFAGAGGSGRAGRMRELSDVIKAGVNPVDTPLADLLNKADIDVSTILRPTTTARRLENWIALADAKTLAERTNHVKAILEQLAFFVETMELQRKLTGKSQRSSWAHLTGARATSGKALIPAYGSRMSPSGDSLRLLAVWGSPTPPELIELLRSEPVDQSIIVLYFGTLDPAARRELATLFHRGRKLPPAVVIDDAAFAYLAVQPEAGRDITMSITLPFTTAFPFTPDVAGLVSPEMFYGRTEERDKVVDMMGPCIVYGGRQLGKSALLRAAAREFDDNNLRHAIYQSIFKVGQSHPVDSVWLELWPSLADKKILPDDVPTSDVAATLIKGIRSWIKKIPGRQLLLLLDESDFFLDGDATDSGFTHVSHFKELMESTDRAVKVVFAGLHKTARFERLANHPLAHFGDPVCVGPLAPQPAYDLLTQPLRALGYHFESNDEQAARVIALANNQPALIQLFGDQLLRNLYKVSLATTAPPHVVTGSDIVAVWSDSALRTSFRKRFEWTLNLDPRYKIIAYSVAFHAHSSGVGSTLTPARLRSECEQWWPQGFAAGAVRTGEFHALLDECVDLGVLSYADGGYRLRTPNILDLLGSRDDVDEVLEQAESTPLPESFDGSLMRPSYCGGPTRGPLTSQQIADLLAQRSQVRLIAGSPALTVQRCAKTLRYENRGTNHLIDASLSQLRKTCDRATLHAAGRHAVVVVGVPDSATHRDVLAAWNESRELIAAHSGGTLGIVIITTAAHVPAWLTAVDQSDASSAVVGLRRYGSTDLRLWLNESSLPFQDDASRNELLAVTGGWPVNVNRVTDELTNNPESPTRDPLGRIRSYLADPVHADNLVAQSGIRADKVLSQAWSVLCGHYVNDLADAATFADYLRLHAESAEPGTEALSADALRTYGYPDTDGVVAVLTTLGVLATAADGLLQIEPVMAQATLIAGADRPGQVGSR